MKRCDPNARSKCPDGKRCELYAEFADGSECDKFNEQVLSRPLTNADRIRAMSDEELEKFINHFDICDIRTNDECEMSYCACCEFCVMDWLQQPAEKKEDNMHRCNNCAHNAVCYLVVLEETLGGKIKPFSCNNYADKNAMPMDEDMALALLAGAAAIEQSPKCSGLFSVGDIDQRTIPFADAARGLRKAGQRYLKLG